ncbi:30S ribosomal protein S18 [Salpingoeca rosetta]|uniref:30S ribosomal protein S18 n=1 Tax=Salpingoeca rosetta (strain ATCC 50818 / BSB-021) TaxID=946362 RepID=F2UC15_SALR5|nr:30S ribosomal protein S18 [Salpingoeca rosetta]EGD74122.1 30S ribosomal protein S18 [Salpingoeca rosetta]|eukprot:XP_004993023.1 30S ribosomal protein S18 [Salpingoeca rosetta]
MLPSCVQLVRRAMVGRGAVAGTAASATAALARPAPSVLAALSRTSNTFQRPLHTGAPVMEATPNRGARGHDLPETAREVTQGCPACPYKEEIDYKNVRFLSQFVSPQTGQILRRSSTGLCSKAQRKIAKAIKRSRHFGLMPHVYRAHAEDPVFTSGGKHPVPSSR